MQDKEKYLNRFKELYHRKNKVVLSDELALKYFEDLVLLVEAIYQPIKKYQVNNE